jgi:hypothetical protein
MSQELLEKYDTYANFKSKFLSLYVLYKKDPDLIIHILLNIVIIYVLLIIISFIVYIEMKCIFYDSNKLTKCLEKEHIQYV